MIVPFHIGVGFLMGIWFTYNLALIPLLIAGFDPFRGRDIGQQESGQINDTPFDNNDREPVVSLEQ